MGYFEGDLNNSEWSWRDRMARMALYVTVFLVRLQDLPLLTTSTERDRAISSGL